MINNLHFVDKEYQAQVGLEHLIDCLTVDYYRYFKMNPAINISLEEQDENLNDDEKDDDDKDQEKGTNTDEENNTELEDGSDDITNEDDALSDDESSETDETDDAENTDEDEVDDTAEEDKSTSTGPTVVVPEREQVSTALKDEPKEQSSDVLLTDLPALISQLKTHLTNNINNYTVHTSSCTNEIEKHIIDIAETLNRTKKARQPTVTISSGVFTNLAIDDQFSSYLAGFKHLTESLNDKKARAPLGYLANGQLHQIIEILNTNGYTISGINKSHNDIESHGLLDFEKITQKAEGYCKMPVVKVTKGLYPFLKPDSRNVYYVSKEAYFGDHLAVFHFTASTYNANLLWKTNAYLARTQPINTQNRVVKALSGEEIVTLLKTLIENLNAIRNALEAIKAINKEIVTNNDKLNAEIIKFTRYFKEVKYASNKEVNTIGMLLIHCFLGETWQDYYAPYDQLLIQSFKSLKAGYTYATKCINNLQ